MIDRNSPAAILGFHGEFRYLSNFWMSRMKIDGVVYSCVEQYYCIQKCANQSDIDAIYATTNPGLMKSLGRKAKLVDNWDSIKDKVMMTALNSKFKNKELAGQLMMTGNRYIEETNQWNDVYWGYCDGHGKNMLGRMLMFIRDTKRQQFEDLPF